METNNPTNEEISEKQIIQKLENDILTLHNNIKQVSDECNFMFSLIQNIFGVQFFFDPKTNSHGYKILVPSKDKGSTGLISEMYQKLEKLWKRYGSEIIIPR